MKIECDIKYDFDDVLIKPKRSNAPSRKSVSLEREFIFPVSGVKWVGCPVIAANMYATGTFEMANVMCNSPHNMMVCLHKHYTDEQIIDYYRTCETKNVFYTTGIKDEDFERIKKLSEYVNFRNICVDAANGHTEYFVKRVRQIRDYFPSSVLMAGNVATSEMVQELILAAGVELVKIGTGGGSGCETRPKTGVGYPQLSCILECAEAAHGLKAFVCSDGGCVYPGDLAKAFGAGADFVMLGGMLAGHKECSSETEFFGMSSEAAMNKFNGGVADYKTSEGRSVKLEPRGNVEKTLLDIQGGLRSACTYVGAEKLKHLGKCTTFLKVNRTHNKVFEGK